GAEYQSKGNYMHRALFVAALENLLKIERTLETNASPLVEITHLANLHGAYEWFGMINHSGQIGSSYREPVPLYDTTIRFKPKRPIQKLILMNSKIGLDFKVKNGWVECKIPKIDDFEMMLCLYDDGKN